MKHLFLKILRHPFEIILLVSLGSLAAVLTGQFAFDLKPCALCLYQRIPFVVAAIVAAAGLFLPERSRITLGLCGFAFLSNSLIALYHSGIERGWWQETISCAANFDFARTADSAQSLMDQIMHAQVESCATIPWADPVLGLSMANYNIALCAGMAVFCFAAILLSLRTTSAPRP